MKNRFHHIGFAVRDLEQSVHSFEMLGAVFERYETDIERNLSFAFGRIGNDGVMIELVASYDQEISSVISGFIKKQSCVPYHICISTDDLENEICRLKKNGFRPIGEAKTSSVYGYDARGVFMYNLGVGLIEIVMRLD